MGVSRGVTATIPTLLMPNETTGARITARIADARRIDDSNCSGRDCFRLHTVTTTEMPANARLGTPAGTLTDSMTVWIDKESYLIRRIDIARQSPSLRSLQTTTYYPTINGAIADSLLKLRPPNR